MSPTGDVPDDLTDSIGIPPTKRAKLSLGNSESFHGSASHENSVTDNFADFDSAELNSDSLWNDISDVLHLSNGNSGDIPVDLEDTAKEDSEIFDMTSTTMQGGSDCVAIDQAKNEASEKEPRVRLASLFLSAPSSESRKDTGVSPFILHPVAASQLPAKKHGVDGRASIPHETIEDDKTVTPSKVRLANIFLSAPFSSPTRSAQPSTQLLSSDPVVNVVSKSAPREAELRTPEHAETSQTAELEKMTPSIASSDPSSKTLVAMIDPAMSSLPDLPVTSVNSSSIKSPEPVKAPELSNSQSLDQEKRRETLMGIVTGIRASPLKAVEQGTVSEDIPQGADINTDLALVETATPALEHGTSIASADIENLESPNKLPSASKMKAQKGQGDVVPRKRAPRKEPKPRMPLEQRVFYSRKEIEVATSFLEDKEDLCDIIPIDDCFLLAECFWIFTVQQLERALNENPSDGIPNYINEMIAKFSKDLPSDPENSVSNTGSHDACAVSRNSVQPEEVVSKLTSNSSDSPNLAITNVLDSIPASLHCDSNVAGVAAFGGAENLTLLSDPLSSDVLHQPESSIEGISAVDRDAIKLNGSREPDSTRVRIIEDKISSWKKAIAEFRSVPRSKTPVQLRFHLDGPIKLLFPESTQNFFKSIEVETLFSFLALRKSETGAVCDLMSIWRRECELSAVPDLGLARHFLGIASRVEAILSAYPPIAEADRGWMLDPISGLTGAARDFLIRHQKITSAAYFLSLRTKEVASILEIWREQNGMDVLRGSGKVAMVSAWKAYIKEALEAESNVGRVIDLSSYLTKVQNDKYTAFLTTTKESSGTGKDSSSDFSLYSKHALEHALGEGATLLLRSAGIQTASQLFAADIDPTTSTLYKVLMDTGIVGGIPAFERAVENWRKSMKEYLEKTPGSKKRKEGHPSRSEAVPQPKRSTPHTAKKADVKPQNTSSSPQEGKMESFLHVNAASEDEVFNALSFTTRQFLQTVGIRTSFDFLSSRSSDLATSFVAWRRAKGKPELKGLGSIASISGWKSIVRKKAKDLGLDGLAEVEPSTRGYKLPQDHTPFPQDFNRDERVEDEVGENADMHESPYRSNGLEVDKKKLFSVQHLGVDIHSVFELSLRLGNKSLDKWDMFISYRGSGTRKCSKDCAESVLQNSLSTVEKEGTRHHWILPDVPICGQDKSETSNCDTRALFSSFFSNAGLIDIGLHGAFPLEPQSLEHLKSAVFVLIRLGYDAPISGIDGPMDHNFNILIRKKRLDHFQYLLLLLKPVECGQTVKVCFPSITSTLRNRKFVQSEYSNMYKIEESLRTLCLDDLRAMLTWLENEVLSVLKTDVIKGGNSGHNFVENCIHRRRLYWIGRRVLAAIRNRRLPADLKMFESLSFCSQKYKEENEWISLTEAQKNMLELNICTQIEVELDYALDQDVSCGTHARSGWDCKAQEFFEHFLSAVAKCIDQSLSDEDQWMSLATFLSKCKGGPSPNSGCLPQNIDDGCTHANDSIVSSEVAKCDLTNIDDPKPPPIDLSDDLMWQIVNSVFEAIRLDFFHIENSDILQSILSTLHAIIFQEDSMVIDPQPMVYKEAIDVPMTLFCPDMEYVPSTHELFLGLVWPTLRTYGWRIFVGSALDDVSFVPKSMSRKRWDAMRRRQDRLTFSLDRDLKYGVHSLSKATKHLFLAVASESHDSSKADSCMSVDACYDPTRSVKAAFDRFRAWLHSKFVSCDDYTKAVAQEIIGNAIISLEECFDTCAAMLEPIPRLLPCFDAVDEEKRPVYAYQSEYLVPFLVSLLSVKEWKSNTGNDVLVDDDLRAFVCDSLLFLSFHYKDLFEERFHPPLEEYGIADTPEKSNSLLWIEQHVHSLISKTSTESAALSLNVDDDMDTHVEEIPGAVPVSNTDVSIDELFEVIREEEKDQLTDFIRVVLENSLPFYASEDDVRRKSGRTLGAPGLACRHCFAKSNEGKYLFSSVESLSACYPVLEKHLYKCTFTPVQTKQLIQKARTLHSEQRREKANGSQQAYFTQLWNRMNKGKPTAEVSKKSRATMSSMLDSQNSVSDGESDDDFDTAVSGSLLDEMDLTDHLKVLDFLRKNLNKMPKSSREDIQDALDTYYSCVDYGGRIYGTSFMPQHFSSRWLLKKLTGHHERSESFNHYVG